MQSLHISNLFLPAWARPCCMETWEGASKGRNSCWLFSQSTVAELCFWDWSSLLFHSITRAQPPASKPWACMSPATAPWAPANLVSCTGLGNSGVLGHQAGLRGLGSLRWRSWCCAEGAGAATWLGTLAEVRGDGHVLQAASSSRCQAIAFGLARVLPALAPTKC